MIFIYFVGLLREAFFRELINTKHCVNPWWMVLSWLSLLCVTNVTHTPVVQYTLS